MDEIIKANQQRRLQQQQQINDSFGIDIQKGRALPIGTIKQRPNGNFIKTTNGWKYHSSRNSSTQPQQNSDTSPTRDLNTLQGLKDEKSDLIHGRGKYADMSGDQLDRKRRLLNDSIKTLQSKATSTDSDYNKKQLNADLAKLQKQADFNSSNYQKRFSGKYKNIVTITLYKVDNAANTIKVANKLGFQTNKTTVNETYGRGQMFGSEREAIIIWKNVNKPKK